MSRLQSDLELLNDSKPWQQWQMDSLPQLQPVEQATNQKIGPAAPKAAAHAETKTKAAVREGQVPDARGVEANARATGFRKGHEEGKKAGFQEGRLAGAKEGYEEGVAKGLEEGRKQASLEFNRQLSETLEPLKSTSREFSAALAALSQDVSSQLIELALAIGQQLALDTVAEKPEVITKAVKMLLDRDFTPTSHPQLLLNPGDLAVVKEHLGSELGLLGWQLKSDEKITRGGCLLKNSCSQIDGTWEQRWRAITARVRRRNAAPDATAAENPS